MGRLELRARVMSDYEAGQVLHPKDYEELVEATETVPAWDDVAQPVLYPSEFRVADPDLAPGAKEIPTKPYDRLLWRAYVAGAHWDDEAYDSQWDDRAYYEGTTNGQWMLTTFYELLDQLRPPPTAAQTMCPLGRPYRQHVRKCSPECDWTNR